MVFIALGAICFGLICLPVGIIAGGAAYGLIAFTPLCFIFMIVICCGMRIVRPNEAYVLQFCGKYVGTTKASGCLWVNPCYEWGRMISTKL